ncbi:UDP-glucose 4-epimerase [Aquimixticola soesokkakensis]|uniref:UDP-glucose 4-epimerase n=1 Tax=Aquimixticola soesokkakensis TaxID=1519096 RepID=A0A1Y5RRQ8_9RHOB|nr:NAD(P)-dependent oxidoreductase [Aquimixticola soesokkakensis]SLN23862.1 UDP-glucose 4-epimerase [Aquimixticola soesokkakensis]
MKRLLITGAAGVLGTMLRERLCEEAEILRLSDLNDLGAARAGEELVRCDLADAAAVEALVEGCDGIVHLGGISGEAPYDLIEAGNLRGVYNLYEAARKHGMPRILFASSNHTIGYYPQGQHLAPEDPVKPDTLYGVSKVFGEAVASFYHSKHGQESALVRIGSCMPVPTNHRMLATWFSYDDFVALVRAVFCAPSLGCPVIWGVSNNDAAWWDNSHVGHLGWQAKDNAEAYRAQIERDVARPPATAAMEKWQGGNLIEDIES